MYANTSNKIKIPKINKTKITKYYLTLLSADKYRKDRTEEVIKCNRFMSAMNATPNEIKTTDLLIENQIQRFTIMKKEDEIRKGIEKKMVEGREIIPIESLGKLPDIEFMDNEYLILQNAYAFNIQTLYKNQEQFMSEFLQYIKFHEHALNLYKSETNDIFIQTALKITEQHKKEIKNKEDNLYKFSNLRQEMERQEVKERENIKMFHDAYSLVLSFGDIEKAKSIKKEIEKEKEKLEGTIEKIQRLEKYETEERDMLENELNYNINNTLSQERNETIQRLEKHETEERDMLEDELNYNINNSLSQEGNNRLGILMQKGI